MRSVLDILAIGGCLPRAWRCRHNDDDDNNITSLVEPINFPGCVRYASRPPQNTRLFYILQSTDLYQLQRVHLPLWSYEYNIITLCVLVTMYNMIYTIIVVFIHIGMTYNYKFIIRTNRGDDDLPKFKSRIRFNRPASSSWVYQLPHNTIILIVLVIIPP